MNKNTPITRQEIELETAGFVSYMREKEINAEKELMLRELARRILGQEWLMINCPAYYVKSLQNDAF